DGTTLRADIYHPNDESRYPTLVCRTPYDKLADRLVHDARALASVGYCVVVQDIRGRNASEGEYRWMFGDANKTFDTDDGYDTVEWAARLPWSDGTVGTWGHSNEGWAAWMTVSSSPPSLRAAFISGITETHQQMTFGIFETGRRLQWIHKMAQSDPRTGTEPTGIRLEPSKANDRWIDVERGKYLWWLPLEEIPPNVFGHLNEPLQTYYREVATNPWDFADVASQVGIPIMQLTGWWDRLVGTVNSYSRLVEHAPPALARQHRLIIGPWGHDPTGLHGQLGPIDYGPDARREMSQLLERWFDLHLKGIDDGIQGEEPVQLFVLGEDKWRGKTSWPPREASEQAFYLHSNGSANTIHGDGSLSVIQPGEDLGQRSDTQSGGGSSDDADSDEFIYDPRDPLMSLMAANSQMIPVDQSPHDGRTDTLVYETAPLTSELELVGVPLLILWASTDCPDTDWSARLALVDENGRAVNLTYGILRAQFRNGFDDPELLTPGKAYEFVVPLNPVGIRILTGQRLRLYVSSSDFPNFDRNHNTGAPFWSDRELRTAHQTVYHSVAMPSRLVLPVAPSSEESRG
ncbi:MAG: CocE/NonD family hydrolase, partial [Acidimicrobiia bacterium]|nr:CocE/NonD family hydrolase [Acidimicrobiia bacterium]